MLKQITDIADGATIETDILIIGGGAAGITMARALGNKGKQVVVLESGGEEFDPDIQELYQGQIKGPVKEPLEISRLRFFGGTTNHWAGWCRPLEAEDFEARPDWPESGWPFGHSALAPYFDRAAEICQLGPTAFDDVGYWADQEGAGDLSEIKLAPNRFRTGVFQVSPPTRFGEAYGAELKQSPSVTVILKATVLGLIPEEGTDAGQARKKIVGVKAGSLDGRRVTVRCQRCVVATGGIESARLLLLSTDVHPNGAGNENDLVGRYFLDHPWISRAAYIHFSKAGTNFPLYFQEHELAGSRMFGTLTSDPADIRKASVGGFRLVLSESQAPTAALDSLRTLGKELGEGRIADGFWGHLGTIISDFDTVADAAYKTAFSAKSSPFAREITSDSPILGSYVDLNFEQVPNRDSRVRLDNDGEADAFGQRRVVVDWQLTDTDKRTAYYALKLLALEAGRTGLGRVRMTEGMDEVLGRWPSRLMGSRHHSGTTRMAEDPRKGVTDQWGRVHSTTNLYVAGSALFPTNGYANPTLTIVALALRQADHLAGLAG